MRDKAVIIISTLVDANIKSYQIDTEFYIFKTIEGLATHLDSQPIRAQTLFFTKEVCGQTNRAFTFIHDLTTNNSYLAVDRVVYITEPESPELESVNYLIDEKQITNWDIIQGGLTKAFVTEVINGTAQIDNVNLRHKAVYRQARAEYVRSKIKEYQSLGEEYTDDEKYLSDLPDIGLPEVEYRESTTLIEKVYITGKDSDERTAFSFLAAQYLSHSAKTIIIESDKEYHRLTEFYTKSGVSATSVTVTELYENMELTLTKIRQAPTQLVVVTCIERTQFDYYFLINFLFYNLLTDFRYMVVETDFEDMPSAQPVTIVLPDTVIGCLQLGEQIDKSVTSYATFVAVNLQDLPEVHLPSSIVISKILKDILTIEKIRCCVVNVTSLRLNGTAYDLGSVLHHDLVRGY